jgi:DNA mismatch endonuclease (patch repair protein)
LTSDFWINKIGNNRKRDQKVNRILRKSGWVIMRVWEHQLKNDYEEVMRKLLKFLK